MRKILLSSAAAFVIATPAFAADLGGYYAPPAGDPIYSPTSMVAGDLQLGLGYVSTDFDWSSSDNSSLLFDGQARANINFGSWNLLVELDAAAVSYDGYSHSSVAILGHVWAGTTVRYGAFGGVGFPTGPNIAVIGLEAEAELGGNFVLGGQAFYITDIADGQDFDGFGLRGWADYYFTPNTKLTGEVLWVDGDDFLDMWNLAGRLTHRFAGTPFNVFGEANYTDFDDGDSWSVLGGFSVLFDGGAATQQDFDRTVPFDFRLPVVGDGMSMDR